MKITKKRFFSFLLLLLFGGFMWYLSSPVQAASSLWDSQQGVDKVSPVFGVANAGAPLDIRVMIVRIINVALRWLAIILIVLMVFSGYQWMTSGGNEESIKKAQKRITNAIIGLVIVLLAWSITQYVLCRLVAVTTGNNNYNFYCPFM